MGGVLTATFNADDSVCSVCSVYILCVLCVRQKGELPSIYSCVCVVGTVCVHSNTFVFSVITDVTQDGVFS